ncbi:MAG: hypothetical protein HGB26_07145, partial [Desulfobulbaceae bacterium]|nr:hypothetical protein [Desulfobulbaceae bacterium]
AAPRTCEMADGGLTKIDYNSDRIALKSGDAHEKSKIVLSTRTWTVLNKEQQRVYEWLNDGLKLPVFAEAYKGAAILLNQKPAGYISFIAHAGRDLMNRLASTVAGIKSERVQYQEHIDKLQEDWQTDWQFSNELSLEVVEKGHMIPIDVCQKISILIDEHKSGRMRSSEADGLFFSTFLDYADRDKIPNNFLSEWKAAKKWFLAHAHLREEPFHSEAENDLIKHFNCLDSYLYIAASSQYDRLKELNEILDATNQ